MFSTIRQSLDTFTYACLIEGLNYPLQVHCLHHIHFSKVRPCLQYGFSLQTETNYRLADKMHMDKSELISAETIYLIITALRETQLTSTILYYGISEKKELFDNTNLWLMQQWARVKFALTSLIATPATALCTAYRKYFLVKKNSFLKSVLT